MPNLNCYKCKNVFEFENTESIGRRDECSQCGADLRVCKNCRHFDVTSRWGCRESISEVVLEKEKANFCDYFQPTTLQTINEKSNSREDLLKLAESLFKKPS